MKRLLIFLSIIFCFPSFGFVTQDLSVNRLQYLRYIRPQMRSIVSDFYSVLKLLYPQTAEVISLKQYMHKIETSVADFQDECLEGGQEKECENKIQQISTQIVRISQFVDKERLRTQSSNFLLNCPEDNQENCLNYIWQLENFSFFSLKLKYNLQSLMLTRRTDFAQDKIHLQEMQNNLNRLGIYWGIMLCSSVAEKHRIVFEDMLSTLIDPLRQISSQPQGHQVLAAKLHDLNISFNMTNKLLMKGTLKADPIAKKLLNTIHFRWNSVLKIVLRNLR